MSNVYLLIKVCHTLINVFHNKWITLVLMYLSFVPECTYVNQGSQHNLETWKTCRYEFYLSRSRNSLEFAQNSKKTWTKQEIDQKTWTKPGMLKIHNISILYCDNFFQVLCFCNFRTPLGSTFWCKKLSVKTRRMAFLTWLKPGQNLAFYS